MSHYIKYPESTRDVSILVDGKYTVDEIVAAIQKVSQNIQSVVLIDHYESPEWQDKKSLTLRYVVQDVHKTLTTQEVDIITAEIEQILKAMGASIR